VPDFYRIFDTTLSCGFALPELPLVNIEDGFRVKPGTTEGGFRVKPGTTEGGAGMTSLVTPGLTRGPSLSVKMGEGGPDQYDAQGFEKAFEWCDYNGGVVCWCERRDDEYLYSFSHSATFHISSEGLISCFLHEGSTMQMLRHLLLNQIIPRYLATTGRLILHASAVTLENGKSVAFLGNSGFGKSTLVSSFHRHGAQLINDDCILLECGEEGVMVIGGLVGIRLFPDSVNAVFNEAAGFTNYTPYTDKQQLFLKGEAGSAQPESCVLDALFLLNDPKLEPADESGDEEGANEIRIEPESGSQAMMAMIYSAFSLDPSDKKMIAGNFRNVGQALGEQLGLYSLKYPRVHERLPEVRAAVIERVE